MNKVLRNILRFNIYGLPFLVSIFLSLPVFAQTTLNFSLTQPLQVEAKYTVDYKSDRVTFVFWDSSSTTITSWFWDFGDSSFANTQHASHKYAEKGIYTVCLAVQNSDNCRDTTCAEVNSYLGIDNEDFAEKSLQVFPNPFRSELNVQLELMKASKVIIKMYNLLGDEVAVLANGRYEAGSLKLTYNKSALANNAGVYFLKIDINGTTITKKVLGN
jgi:hypothetical protein